VQVCWGYFVTDVTELHGANCHIYNSDGRSGGDFGDREDVPPTLGRGTPIVGRPDGPPQTVERDSGEFDCVLPTGCYQMFTLRDICDIQCGRLVYILFQGMCVETGVPLIDIVLHPVYEGV
jgi:hypothetical protein